MKDYIRVQASYIGSSTTETMELSKEMLRKLAKTNDFLVMWEKPIEVKLSRKQPGVALVTFHGLAKDGAEQLVIEKFDLKDGTRADA